MARRFRVNYNRNRMGLNDRCNYWSACMDRLTGREKWLIEQGCNHGRDDDNLLCVDAFIKENESRLATEAPSDWISVDERLPEEQQKILVILRSGIILTGAYIQDSYCIYSTETDRYSEIYTHVLSHWQPLPAPPEKDK